MEVLRDWLRDAMQQQDGEDRGWPAFSMMALCTWHLKSNESPRLHFLVQPATV
jgi:hypothetical protein